MTYVDTSGLYDIAVAIAKVHDVADRRITLDARIAALNTVATLHSGTPVPSEFVIEQAKQYEKWLYS